MIMISVFLVIIAIVVFYIGASMKGEELSMSKLRNIYLYLVSFVSLMMILGGLIFTVQNITDVIFPTNYYIESMPMEKMGNVSPANEKYLEENQKKNMEIRIIESKKNVAKSLAVVFIALPAFIYHWRKIEKEKKELV